MKVAVIAAFGCTWLEELVLSLVQAGARVVVAGAQREIANAVMLAQQAGGETVEIPANVAHHNGVQSMVSEAVSKFAKIDILVNCLNLELWKPLLNLTEQEMRQLLDSNLTSTFLCSQAVGKHMVEQKKGSIINIISGLAERELQNGSAYCASMGGILQLTRALALEWAQHNVRVNAIGVGWAEKLLAKGEKDMMARYIPMQRRARPEDITPLVVLLTSEGSSYLSENIYLVEGGLMARG